MRTVSETYRRLLADLEHGKEVKVEVAGTEYGQDRIFTLSISGGLFSNFAVGGCVSREIELTLEPVNEVPRMARIRVFTRLVLGDEHSEWVPGGVFYTDTRAVDKVSGVLTIHGFDAMLKAEPVWWDPAGDLGEWPKSQRESAEDIAARMGTELDPRCQFASGLRVEYPNDLTMREVLGEIAASNAGSWSITGEGKLLLTPLCGLPPETRFLVDGGDGGTILFGEVRLLV